jgi:hypothetical protein
MLTTRLIAGGKEQGSGHLNNVNWLGQAERIAP